MGQKIAFSQLNYVFLRPIFGFHARAFLTDVFDVLDIFSGFGVGAPRLQSQGRAPWGRGWTSSIKLLTLSGLKCAISLYFAQTLLRDAKLARGCQNCKNFFFKQSKVTQVF